MVIPRRVSGMITQVVFDNESKVLMEVNILTLSKPVCTQF